LRMFFSILPLERPVQIIFAGKAHPKDNQGKELIRDIVHFARDEDIRRSVVFLEDYDMDLARDIVQGVDVWLNTPRRLMEASGTSGMKTAINGAINLSILDGWWYEGYRPDTGWAIGGEEHYDDLGYQDAVESHALYDLLEKEVIPLFYQRGDDNLPREWVGLMKNSMKALSPVFNSHRMVKDYTEQLYSPSALRWKSLRDDGFSRAKSLAKWKEGIRSGWPEMRLKSIDSEINDNLKIGQEVEIRTTFELGTISPQDISVEVLFGPLNEKAEISEETATSMRPVDESSQENAEFTGTIVCQTSGRCGYAIRILPKHEDLNTAYEMGLVRWF